MSKFIAVAGVALLGLLILFLGREKSSSTYQLSINGNVLFVEIADTVPLREKGLGGRTHLDSNSGMLFVFEEPTVPSFWMKNMRFPIDIIWISHEKQIIGVETEVRPESYPQTFSPSAPVKYVLEVNGGWTEQNSVEIKGVVDIHYQ